MFRWSKIPNGLLFLNIYRSITGVPQAFISGSVLFNVHSVQQLLNYVSDCLFWLMLSFSFDVGKAVGLQNLTVANILCFNQDRTKYSVIIFNESRRFKFNRLIIAKCT